LVDLLEGEVHEVVARDKVAVEGLAVLELDELCTQSVSSVSLRGERDEKEGQTMGFAWAAWRSARGSCRGAKGQ
jgi:hypothetical protein